MKKFAAGYPERKPLLGMGGAFVFFVSLIPIPAFTGTCSHPCGTPLIAILLGPTIGIALAGISLLLQAAFFAHGGFSTWGANVLSLGFCGCFCGWATFRLARKLGLPIWLAGFITDEPLLEEVRLEPPILTKLFQRAMKRHDSGNGIPVTIEEAAALLTSQKETPWKLPK